MISYLLTETHYPTVLMSSVSHSQFPLDPIIFSSLNYDKDVFSNLFENVFSFPGMKKAGRGEEIYILFSRSCHLEESLKLFSLVRAVL